MTREELEGLGEDLIRTRRIVGFVIEEAQSGELRLLVREDEDRDFAPLPLQPAD